LPGDANLPILNTATLPWHDFLLNCFNDDYMKVTKWHSNFEYGNITFNVKLSKKRVFVTIQSWLKVSEDGFENKETFVPEKIIKINTPVPVL